MVPDLAVWSRRVPLALVSLLVAVPLLALAIAEMVAAPPCTSVDPCRDELGTSTYWLDAPTVFVALASIILVWLVPRVSVWAAVLVGLASGLPGGSPTEFPDCWLALSGAWLLLGILEVSGRWRQARLAQSWAAPTERPPIPPRRLDAIHDTRLVTAALCALLVVAAAVLLFVHHRLLSGVEEFEQSAVVASGTVIDDGVDGPLVVDAGGRRYEISTTTEVYPTGSQVDLLLHPATGRAALVSEPMDPSWLVGCSAVALLLVACVATVGFSRGRRQAQLVANGGPAYRLYLAEINYAILSDTPDPPTRRHEFLVGELVPIEDALVDDRAAEAAVPQRALGVDAQPPVSDLSDDQVRVWADELDDDDKSDAETHAAAPPRQVTVIGHLVDGYPLLVVDGNHVAITARPVRDPWPLRRLPELLHERHTQRPRNKPSVSEQPGSPSPTVAARPSRGARHWPSRAALPLAYALAVPAGVVLWWLFHDPIKLRVWSDAIGTMILAIAAAGGLHRLASIGRATLSGHRCGLRLEGPMVTTIIPRQRVRAVVTAQTTVVLRLRDPDDLVAVDSTDVAMPNGAGRPAEAAAAVESWLRSTTDRPQARTVLRPSPPIGPPLLLVATSIVLILSYLN